MCHTRASRAHAARLAGKFGCRKKTVTSVRRDTTSKRREFVFKLGSGLDQSMACQAVCSLAFGKDTVRSYVGGFEIGVHCPQQAEMMHTALRQLDCTLQPTIDLKGWKPPKISARIASDLEVGQQSAEAIVLEGYTYPLYRVLQKLGYVYVRNLRGESDVNRWVRAVRNGESAVELQRDICAKMHDLGWQVQGIVKGQTE